MRRLSLVCRALAHVKRAKRIGRADSVNVQPPSKAIAPRRRDNFVRVDRHRLKRDRLEARRGSSERIHSNVATDVDEERRSIGRRRGETAASAVGTGRSRLGARLFEHFEHPFDLVAFKAVIAPVLYAPGNPDVERPVVGAHPEGRLPRNVRLRPDAVGERRRARDHVVRRREWHRDEPRAPEATIPD